MIHLFEFIMWVGLGVYIVLASVATTKIVYLFKEQTMAKAVRTSKGVDRSEFDRLVKRAIDERENLRKFEEEHADVLDEYKEMTTALEGINERIKVEARKLAVLGETKVLVDNKLIHVSVFGAQDRVFDLVKIHKHWDKTVVRQAVKEIVDKKVVDALKETGVLDEDSIEKVVTYTPATARVTVRIN